MSHFAELLPLKAQRRPQARLEKPFALGWVEPRPARSRWDGLSRAQPRIVASNRSRGISRPFKNENSANETQKSRIAKMLIVDDRRHWWRKSGRGRDSPRQRVIT
ncbi:hypothetical protein ABIB94_009285 [Bradyrhizobium sp. JR7.2]|uniref:hypothetical protein n=1 Tax=unclassified Bradyrhizobium TaxID=2631580 RepID=UPI0033994CD6